MQDNRAYATYAVMCELNSREFKKRLSLFPEDQRYQIVLASSRIGGQNAGRMEETHATVVSDAYEFVEKLLGLAGQEQDEVFKGVLEACLIETINDELRYCCSNCANFSACLEMENVPIGNLFRRRTDGEDTEALKKEIACCIDQALQRTPHLDSDNAHLLCGKFRHQYPATASGEIFNRYADIAAELQHSYGINYRKIQQEMIRVNMDFVEKDRLTPPA